MMRLLKTQSGQSLPASHVVELTFRLPRLCRWRNRQCTGNTDEIRRAGARDRTGRARERNLHSLERAWFDIPIVCANRRCAIAAIEKGKSGEQAFKAAFTAWGHYPATVQPGLVVTAPGRCTGHA
jgi:hypothetical protein